MRTLAYADSAESGGVRLGGLTAEPAGLLPLLEGRAPSLLAWLMYDDETCEVVVSGDGGGRRDASGELAAVGMRLVASELSCDGRASP